MGLVFKFKKFEVDQAGCAMKINTDGVLLGAIATQQQPAHILDIGTGTGVIAMMLAQRFPDSVIDAVEIDESAAIAAGKNFTNSPFSNQLSIYHTPVELYTAAVKYDLIVSNPPYFVNDLKSTEKRKEIARHADEDFFDLLLIKIGGILNEKGLFWLILPVKQAEKVIINAVLQRLFPSRIIHVFSDASKDEFRQIICLGFVNTPAVHENVYIYEETNVYTMQYKEILKDFLLAF